MQIDTFGAYIRRRLEHWGEEFALHRDVEWLGYSSKTILKVLMEHRGMPGRATGFKPIETDQLAQQIEDVVSDISKKNAEAAWVLRAYYCGIGRRSVERYETANMLLANAGLGSMSLRKYNATRVIGDDMVANAILEVARAA